MYSGSRCIYTSVLFTVRHRILREPHRAGDSCAHYIRTPQSIILSLAGRNQLFHSRRKMFPLAFPRRFRRRYFAVLCVCRTRSVVWVIRRMTINYNIVFHCSSAPYNRAVHIIIYFSVSLVSTIFFFSYSLYAHCPFVRKSPFLSSAVPEFRVYTHVMMNTLGRYVILKLITIKSLTE